MKKSELSSCKETPEAELKRLRKENKSLKSDLNKTVAETFDFKDRLINVKLKDIDTWSSENMSTNRVTKEGS